MNFWQPILCALGIHDRKDAKRFQVRLEKVTATCGDEVIVRLTRFGANDDNPRTFYTNGVEFIGQEIVGDTLIRRYRENLASDNVKFDVKYAAVDGWYDCIYCGKPVKVT